MFSTAARQITVSNSDFCCLRGMPYVALTLCFKLISFFTLITHNDDNDAHHYYYYYYYYYSLGDI